MSSEHAPRGGRALFWAAILLALSLEWTDSAKAQPPASVLPGLGPSSVRVMVDASQLPWRGVVRVQTEVGVHCSGALVGPRLVLTAAHCLFGRGTGQRVRPQSIHVLIGYSHGDYAGHARAVSVDMGAGFAVGPDGERRSSAPPDADWAIMTLDTRLGAADRVLPFVKELPPRGTPAMLGGFEQDRAEVIVADTICMVNGPVYDRAGHVLLRHSCAATRGVSGAPLLVRTPDGNWAIAGVAFAARIGTSGGYAVPVSAIADDALGKAPDR